MMMKDDRLRRYVRLLVAEALRDARFKESELKNFKNLDDIHDYSSKYLTKLGEGSSRIVYLLSSKKVLKVSLNEKGYAQNEAEVNVYTSPSTRNIVAKIFDYDKNYKWIVSELVKPLEDEHDEHFFRRFDAHFYDFVDGLNSSLSDSSFDDIIDGHHYNNIHLAMMRDRYDDVSDEYIEFFNDVLKTVKSGKILIGDLYDSGHWGYTPEGRIVLLDYGFTDDVANKYY